MQVFVRTPIHFHKMFAVHTGVYKNTQYKINYVYYYLSVSTEGRCWCGFQVRWSEGYGRGEFITVSGLPAEHAQ